MKLILTLLLLPTLAFADKYDDAKLNLQNIQVALSNLVIQGMSATLLSQVQSAIAKTAKDMDELQKEHKEVSDKCKDTKEAKK